ncbi:MAG: glycosyltransferase family 61 protein [Lachnospiraceae bacterium]|nr:glycosyltransferase family 61 protein [Lachnospiraceae bacterium]
MKIDYRFMRPEKAKAVRKLHEAPFEKKTELRYESFRNALILPIRKFAEDNEALLFGRGCLIDEAGDFVEASGIPGRVGGAYPSEIPPLTDRKVVFCGYLAAGWGHFLVESVTRLWYALREEEGVDSYVFVNVENAGSRISGNFRSFLELLGIYDRTVLLDSPAHFREVILPERAYVSASHCSDEYNELIDAVIRNAPEAEKDSPERVFFSRAHLYDKKHFYGRRRSRERGLDMLDDYFARNGFAIVYPERTELREQLRLMRGAKLLASESGSCAHNMLLAPKGASTLIMERQALPNRFQAEIDRMRDLDCRYVDSYYALYPTADFGGPYLLMYSEQMKRFSEAFSYQAPDARFLTEAYERASVKWFMRLYRHLFGKRFFWGDEIDRVSDWAEVFSEVNDESYEHFRAYLETGWDRFLFRLTEKIGY